MSDHVPTVNVWASGWQAECSCGWLSSTRDRSQEVVVAWRDHSEAVYVTRLLRESVGVGTSEETA